MSKTKDLNVQSSFGKRPRMPRGGVAVEKPPVRRRIVWALLLLAMLALIVAWLALR